jgi:murein DD-endopeptidase MepM/ murein hydrolase activator NlpD
MHEGTVVAVRNTFAAGEFRRNSYGNIITVQSIINGQVVRLTYAHLNNVNVTVGQAVYAGQIIGKTGDTGNAQTKGDTIVLPHVHVKASTLGLNQQEIKANPNNYMATKFNSDGTVNTATSTCNQ